MRTSFAAIGPLPQLTGHSLQTLTLELHAASYDSYGKLSALGGPAAVLAAGEPHDNGFDDWAGGFDIHLGVYTQD